MSRPPHRQGRRTARPAFCRPRLESLEDRTLLDVNPIVTENLLPGNPVSEWGLNGLRDPDLEGFATRFSVDQGETVRFKINSPNDTYRLDIYRMGFYGGLGARKVATILPTSSDPITQPAALTDTSTGLVDAGNWSETASWAVPATATSGVYFGKLVRPDGTSGNGHIVFVVRDDDGRSDLLFQTSDTTWQAYNEWGGSSLYRTDLPNLPQRGYKVSYNRPFSNLDGVTYYGVENWFLYSEFPMVQWLEANGYHVSYTSGIDTASRGDEIREHKVFLSVGHDEYWSAEQRGNVEAAVASGVNLGFFSGNEVYWKTRWETSLDGSGTPFRTLVCYKESVANAKIDPSDAWTGTWADPRFSPPSDGGRPQNALTGQQFAINGTWDGRIWVPEEEGKLRFWRNTSVANLEPGQSAGLVYGSLGYEADIDADNGARPAGSFRVSEATYDVPFLLQGYAAAPQYAPGTATHSMTLFRRGSAWVFGAGTIQWSWGLSANSIRIATQPDVRMQQATVNLFADMGSQPGSLRPGLVAATASTDVTPPALQITAVLGQTNAQVGATVSLLGTAADIGGRVAGVEVSTDGGSTWRRAAGRASWRYDWVPTSTGSFALLARAIDDSGNTGSSAAVAVEVGNPIGTPPAFFEVTATELTAGAVTISWTTNEPATSRIDYGPNFSSLTESAEEITALRTEHSLQLTGLVPNSTYVFRLSGTDNNNNTSHTGTAPYYFTTPAFQVSTAAEIQSGTVPSSLYVAQDGDGELILAPSVVAEFNTGGQLDLGWSGTPLGPFGSFAVSDGAVSIRQAQVASNTVFTSHRSMEFVATFNEVAQFGGFSIAAGTTPFALFGVNPTGELHARTATSPGTIVETPLALSYLKSRHRFRIDWNQTNVEYWIDGVRVASHNTSFTAPVRALLADQGTKNSFFVVDSVRVGGYPASGTFVSPVYDAGSVRRMGPIAWEADIPVGTSLIVSVRTGDTPAPDASWTDYSVVATSGADIGRLARYVQFSVELATSTGGLTPALRDIHLGHGPDVAVDFAATAATGSEATAAVNIPVRLTASSPLAVTVNYSVTGGTATAGVDFAPLVGTLVFLPGETSKSIPLAILNEAVIEPEETIVLTLSAPSYAGLGANSTFTYTITDDDPNGAGIVIDDHDPGYSATGAWLNFRGIGFGNDVDYIAAGPGNQFVTWTFPVSPGQYRVSATWHHNTNRSPNAPYTILDGANVVGTFAIDQRAAPADFTEGGVGWEDLDVVPITGDTLVVRLSADASPSFVIADAIRIAWQRELATGPEARVFDGATAVFGGSTINLGNVMQGQDAPRTFTVTNAGVSDLVLDANINVPAGYLLVAGFGQTTLAPNESTTFTLRPDTATPGVRSGEVSFASNDPQANPFRFNLTALVSSFEVIDDGDAGFAASAGWLPYTRGGHQGDMRYAFATAPAEAVTWTFTVTPGRYRVAATWAPDAVYSNNAGFAILDGAVQAGFGRVDQRFAPNDFTASGSSWENLDTVDITGNTLAVRLTAGAHPSYVVADAIRIERLTDLPSGPQVHVALAGSPNLSNGGSLDLGTTLPNLPIERTFTVRNVGDADLVLGTISVPAGYTLAAGFGQAALAPGASTTFTVRLDAAALGTYSGSVSFGSNDANDDPFALTLTGRVSNTVILDDGQAGFTTSGLWAYFTSLGRDSDLIYAIDNPVEATWSFPVTPGEYRVSTTWQANTNRSPSVPHAIFDGANQVASVNIDQRLTPADFTDAGSGWKDLETVQVHGNTLRVKLTHSASGVYVIADAVRIQRVGDLLQGPHAQVRDGTVRVDNGGSINLGSTVLNAPVTRTLTVRNVGTEDLVLGAISVPAGFSLVAGFGQATLAPGASTTFTVRHDAAAAGAFSGQVSFASNDPNDDPYRITLTGEVVTALIVDDGDSGFSTNGAWQRFAGGVGHAGDFSYIESSTSGATANWTFALAPGRYRVSATWHAAANRANNVVYTLFDTTQAVATTTVDQRLTPSDFTANGSSWKDLDTVQVVNGTLIVRLSTNANPTYVIADAIRVVRVGDVLQGPEVQVRDGAAIVANGATVDLGGTLPDVPLTRTFTVRNGGTQDLVLDPNISVPAGFTLATGLGSTILSPGATTTFAVRLDAATAGVYTGEVALASNDPNVNPFRFTLRGSVGTVLIRDDGDVGYTTTGPWQTYNGAGRNGDFSYIDSGNGSAEARWTFAVSPGQYRVSATWHAAGNRATNAPYAILDGTTTVGAAAINQRLAPSDFTDGGTSWEDIDTVQVTGNTLVVRLTNAAGPSYVIADAVRIERLGGLLQGPQVQVRDGAGMVGRGATVDLGRVMRDVPRTRTFTVRNAGTEDLVLDANINLPAGYVLESGFGATTLAPEATTTFTIRLTTAVVGTYSGEVSFGTNDADDNPFRFLVTAEVADVLVIDDGEEGFTATGGWTSYSGAGRANDFTYIQSGTGSQTAAWTFAVAAGTYRVSATWHANANRATNAPYTILDGAGQLDQVRVDQRQAPNDFSEGGSAWEDLATVTVSDGVLVVRLSDDADAQQFVIADAIRIERVS